MRRIVYLLGDRTVAARVAAAANTLLGSICLVGWAVNLKALTSVIPGSVEMKANTGVCLVLCGIALFLLAGSTSRRLYLISQWASGTVMLVGIATLAEYSFGWNLGIDEFLVRDSAGAYNVFRGRMSPYSAAAFLAVSAALLTVRRKRLFALAQWGGLCALMVGLISLLGYLWNASEIVTDTVLPPVALNTAVCFTLLASGILLLPQSGAMAHRTIRGFVAVELKFLAGFVASMTLLIVGGSYTYHSDARFSDSLQEIARTQEIRASLASLYGSLAGAEIALRDYFLTADEGQRAEYETRVRDVNQQIRTLQQLAAYSPQQRQNLAELTPLVAVRLAAIAGELEAYADFGLPAARAVIRLGRGTISIRQVRAVIDRMSAVEENAIAARQNGTTDARNVTLLSLLVTLAVAAGFFTLLFRGIHVEMLARRDAESALQASEEYNRSIVDSSPDCLAVLTLGGKLQQMTPQGRRLLEIDDAAALPDLDYRSLWSGEERTAADAAFEAARTGEVGRFQIWSRTFKGTPKWWDVIMTPVLGVDGRPDRLLAVARDISEEKRGESSLLAANRFLDSLIENLPAMVSVKEASTLRFVRVNTAFERLLGYSRETVLGKSARELFPAHEAEFSMAKDREALQRRGLVEIDEQQVNTPHLGTRSFQTMKLPIQTGQDEPQFLLSISVDISERKLAEQAIQALNSALQTKAEQLAATNDELESFSYSVSHDLRAPLRAIDGFAQMLEEDNADSLGAEGRRFVAVIRENSRRMGELIDDLLAFSRLGRLPVVAQDVDVEALVREVVEEALQGQPGTQPVIDIGPLPATRGDRGLLRQVWANLIANAIKYSSKSPQARIEVSSRQQPTEIMYSVRDNGVGFDMAYADKLFGVFQRLHRADEFSGTGVGLAIVHRVVTRHGGRVWAEGKLNEGAVFSFSLPKVIK